MKNIFNNVKIYIIIALLGFLSSELLSAEEIVERVIARVNNEPILLSEFNNRAGELIEQFKAEIPEPDQEEQLKEFKRGLLDQMIDEKLLIQQAEKKEIAVTPEEIDQGMDEIRGRFDSEMEFQNEITKQGLTGENFRENLGQQIKVIKLTNQEVRAQISPPTEEEVRTYYRENEEAMVVPPQIRARHILITLNGKTEEEAKNKIDEIYAKAKKTPQNFSNMAEEYSDGPSALRGGDLGYFSRTEMPQSFSDAAFDLDIDEISEPVQTRFGYHIIKVVGKRASEKRTFSEIKDQLKNLLYQRKMEEAYDSYLRELRDEARISTSLFTD